MEEVTENGMEQTGNEGEELNHSLTFEDKVIKKIAGYASGEIPGIIAMSGNLFSGIADRLKSADDPTKGISVEVGKKQVAIDMNIICEYGRDIHAIFLALVDCVSKAVKSMTGLDVVEMNVHVIDVLLKEDFNKKKGIVEERLKEAEAEEEERIPEELRRVE